MTMAKEGNCQSQRGRRRGSIIITKSQRCRSSRTLQVSTSPRLHAHYNSTRSQSTHTKASVDGVSTRATSVRWWELHLDAHVA